METAKKEKPTLAKNACIYSFFFFWFLWFSSIAVCMDNNNEVDEFIQLKRLALALRDKQNIAEQLYPKNSTIQTCDTAGLIAKLYTIYNEDVNSIPSPSTPIASQPILQDHLKKASENFSNESKGVQELWQENTEIHATDKQNWYIQVIKAHAQLNQAVLKEKN